MPNKVPTLLMLTIILEMVQMVYRSMHDFHHSFFRPKYQIFYILPVINLPFYINGYNGVLPIKSSIILLHPSPAIMGHFRKYGSKSSSNPYFIISFTNSIISVVGSSICCFNCCSSSSLSPASLLSIIIRPLQRDNNLHRELSLNHSVFVGNQTKQQQNKNKNPNNTSLHQNQLFNLNSTYFAPYNV